ncbi:MAG: hypothetical protein HY719_05630 [Planctomycetes bacterium]|nr:hypothetical protein [Planctomycetota bacterium]
MNNLLTAAVAVVLGAGAGVGAAWVIATEQQADIADLRAQVVSAKREIAGLTRTTTDLSQTVESGVADLKTQVDKAQSGATRAEQKADAVKAEAARARSAAKEEGDAASVARDLKALQGRVAAVEERQKPGAGGAAELAAMDEKALAEKIRELQKKHPGKTRNDEGKWTPTPTELQRELELDAKQADVMNTAILKAQKEFSAILRKELPDGTIIGQHLFGAFMAAKQKNDPTRMQAVMSMKVPGEQRNVGELVGEIQVATQNQFSSVLSQQQIDELAQNQFDLFGVQMPNSPMAEAFQEVARRGMDIPAAPPGGEGE